MSTLEQTSSINLQDIKLSYSEAGKGEPILCLHGNPGNKNIFSNIMAKLDGANIKLYALDRPGHNATDELPNEKNDLWYDTSIYADFIKAKLNKKAWILGHSYGCLTAVKVAIKHPEQVKGLILINPLIATATPNESTSSIPYFAKGPLTGSILGIWLPMAYPQVLTDLLNQLFQPEKPSEEFAESWLQKFIRFENVVAYQTDRNIQIKIQDELKEEMKKISLKTYALYGAKDGYTDISRQQEIVNLIPGVKSETSESSGHYMPHLNPDICLDFIKNAVAG
ncbi:MAG: alpha/beta hydrolase [Candidatus Riflebacteria bacterium]|nr:alpha/beta hydrolase [Candidatus Riflebacteria bacterium]